ncbi:MAG: cation diffusion facilitator family transporter [Caulobacteraceae bacterium]
MQSYAIGSIAVGLIVLGLKYLAYKVTGSVALYSDAIETVVNVATAVAAFFAIRISALPADANHPYGHSKAEYFSAVLEGVLIILASLVILREAWMGFSHPKPLDTPILGLAITTGASAVNAVWSFVLIRQGRKVRSPALVADGRHLLSDLYISGGVIVGVALVALTGLRVLDAVVAALVAVYVIWSGWGLMKESVGGLMDEAIPDDELKRAEGIIEANLGQALEAHDLRTRQAGRTTFIDFHLVVPGALTVSASHAICDHIEDALKREFGETVISIHVEPEEKIKTGGGVSSMGDPA